MEWLKGFFKDTGDQSMTRLMSFISLLVASGIAIYGIAKQSDLSAVAMLVGAFLGPAYAAKAYQSKVEHEASKDE